MSQKNKGILLIISSAFFFALMNMMVRLSGDLPSMEKSFFRNFVAMFFSFFMLKRSGTPIRVPKGSLKPLLMRSVCGTVGILCNYYAIDHLMLADASILNKLSPFFAILFSYILLKEKIHPFAAGCVITAFIGSLFIIRPGLGMFTTTFPAFIGFLGGLGVGIAYTYVRILGTHGVKGPFIVFFFSTFSCLVTLPYLILDFHPMSLAQLGCLLLAGLFASGGQFTITAAYTYAPARDISIYDYSQILFSTALGYLFLDQIPDYLSFIGYGIIILASFAMFLFNQRKAATQ
ncbi:MAG: DMT family transporter [Clostridiales bacterium]|nr:DMT family transporter [Clostridiales bacterium]